LYQTDEEDWYPFANLLPKEGDLIRMQICGNQVGFFINEKFLGVAFKDDRISTQEVRPFVFLVNYQDRVEILDGNVY